MRLFLLSFTLVALLSAISGYIALYTPKFSRPSNVYTYPQEYLKIFTDIEAATKQNRVNEALDLCNDAIANAPDQKVVAKAYFLRSKVYKQSNDIENAKKDILYAKEIDFETFSTKAAYSFIKSLRELTLYESELFSNRKKDFREDLKPSLYYILVLFGASALILLIRSLSFIQKENSEETV